MRIEIEKERNELEINCNLNKPEHQGERKDGEAVSRAVHKLCPLSGRPI